MSIDDLHQTTAPTVFYLTKRFPRLSETFILDEILGLEAHGVDLRLFAIADPHEEDVQSDVDRVRSPVTYLRTGEGWRAKASDYAHFVGSHALIFRRRPRQWTRAAAHVLGSGPSWAMATHFVEAGRMAAEMERVGGDHIHAAFAHGPASVAYYVHLLTDRPFSFAAHAKDLYLSTPEVLATKIAASTFVLACSGSAAGELRSIVASQAEVATDVPVDRVVLAPPGVDIDRFQPGPLRPRRVSPQGVLRILAVGRLVPKKGYPVLLEGLAALVERGVEFECRIVGGGGQKDELHTLVTKLGLGTRVTLCGPRTQQEIIREYHQADVFVQASVITADGDRDGIPNSVLEAMACGLAVVATTVPGIPEVIRDRETGLLVATGQPEPMAGALEALADDDTLRRLLGDAARRFVVDHLAHRSCVELPADLLLGRITAESLASKMPA